MPWCLGGAFGVFLAAMSAKMTHHLTATVTEDNESCCRPGDFTITPVPSGFMVGRSLPATGPGPWWQYIKVVNDLEEARRFAVELAAQDGSRAWFHLHGDQYDEVTYRPPQPAAPDASAPLSE